MKLQFLYVGQNLTRNPVRTLLTCAAVALPITIFVLTSGVIDGIDRVLDNSSRQLRLAVTQKTSIINPLPAGHRAKIESLDPTHTRLISVCCMRYLGGRIENDRTPLSTVAADPDSFPATYPEHLRDPAELEAWQRDRQAIIIGRGTASRLKKQVGDRITIRVSMPPYSAMQFHIVSTAPSADDPVTNICRRDYIEEEIKRTGWLPDLVSFIFVKCASMADMEHYRTAIDDLFAKSLDETVTQDEKTLMSQYIAQQFNLPRNLRILAGITILVAVLAAANTMSMNFRDRRDEFAALRAIGFGKRVIFALIQSESLLVCILGGLFGAFGPYVAFTFTPLRDYAVPVIQKLDISPAVCAEALAIAVLIGLLASAWPCWLAVRLRVVDAFRALE